MRPTVLSGFVSHLLTVMAEVGWRIKVNKREVKKKKQFNTSAAVANLTVRLSDELFHLKLLARESDQKKTNE